MGRRYLITEFGILGAIASGGSIISSLMGTIESLSALKRYAANILGMGERIKAADMALENIQNDPEINVLKAKKKRINAFLDEIKRITDEIMVTENRLNEIRKKAEQDNQDPASVKMELDTLNNIIAENKKKLFILKTKVNAMIKDYNDTLANLKERYS